MRTLIIGDIHGCASELFDLLDKAALGAEDRILALGDLVDRGPAPRRVYEFFRDTPQAQSLRGNHEDNHLRMRAGELTPRLGQLLTRWHLDEEYAAALAYFERLPLYVELEEALLVHGFLEPGIALEAQARRVMLGTLSAEARLKRDYDRPWYELYTGEKPLLVGHRDYSGEQQLFVYEERIYGLDTRCVYGGWLTGLVLPDWRFIQVKARRNHWGRIRESFTAPNE